jgi:hypothetical protein
MNRGDWAVENKVQKKLDSCSSVIVNYNGADGSYPASVLKTREKEIIT